MEINLKSDQYWFDVNTDLQKVKEMPETILEKSTNENNRITERY